MTTNQHSRRRSTRRRRGFTLLEILTSVTLGLMLMYAVARIFSQVGGAMNETMSAMETSNALRNAKQRLTADLEALSVTPAPPRNSRRDEGFFCYVEGMGGPRDQVLRNAAQNSDRSRYSTINGSFVPLRDCGLAFSTGDVALDGERFASATNAGEYADSTVGDVDDILSFTAKAPQGVPFKGRFLVPNANGVGVVPSTIETEYAEIIWFVRGTTLYRRVLPIVPDQLLQDSFGAIQASGGYDGFSADALQNGTGFYRFYDVSVHKNQGGLLVANTLGDLSNRKNRYFYWNSLAQNLPNPLTPHGATGAWYWLRMATLQESARSNFIVGEPFGGGNAESPWPGYYLSLSLPKNVAAGTPLNSSDVVSAGYLPQFPKELSPTSGGQKRFERFPFIDFWNNPNLWEEVDSETGDLLGSVETVNDRDLVFNQDVVLTNVISFNVRAWDPKMNAYVNLGEGIHMTKNDPNNPPPPPSILDDPNDLRSYGRYGNKSAPYPYGYYPCVYDTWTEQYQREACLLDESNRSSASDPDQYEPQYAGSLAQIPLDGDVASADLPDFPPPYDVKLQGLQIEIRVFDPRSKNLRNATFNVDFTRL